MLSQPGGKEKGLHMVVWGQYLQLTATTVKTAVYICVLIPVQHVYSR